MELGETVHDAAVRETCEELEMEIELGTLVGVYSRAQERTVLVVFHTPARWGSRARRRKPRCKRSPPRRCRGTTSRSGRPSRRCATRWPEGARAYAVSPARERAPEAVTVVIGRPSGLSLLGRSLRSQRDTRAGSVEMMISS